VSIVPDRGEWWGDYVLLYLFGRSDTQTWKTFDVIASLSKYLL